ncbi:hypothetical protein B0H34DRAFT_798759 [Crassisporium funariophilum]|nr:hypothetical protein B0H34DRAFT_798759 [Crassisporium funariophilum]
MTNDIMRLPVYPSTQTRKDLSPSQLASLNQSIATGLNVILALPAEKRDIPSTRNYLASYAKDVAFHALQNLIWKETTSSNYSIDERLIQKRTLLLAEKLASTPPGLDIQILLDLAIIYSRSHPALLRPTFLGALQSQSAVSSSLLQSISADLVPGFTLLLSQQRSTAQGLYAQRKVAECIYAFLHAAKSVPEFVRPFAHSKPFILALATLYDSGLTAIAASYGGLPALTAGMSGQGREADEWERIWVETKVTLLDSFHIILTTLLADLASCPQGPQLAVEAERTFDTVFALLEVPSSSGSAANPDVPPTPFLDRPLLADYQQSYSLSKTLAKALHHAQEKDVRLDLLESTLQALDNESNNDSNNQTGSKGRNAGALKILLRSSGVQPGIDNRGNRSNRATQPAVEVGSMSTVFHNISTSDSKGKGKSRAHAAGPVRPDFDLDMKVTQVLDILPDTAPEYIRLLLAHDRYAGDAEKVVEALLEGTALSEEDLEHNLQVQDGSDNKVEEEYSLDQRRNVFDDEVLDIHQLRIGKKSAGDEILKDRTFIEEMKADILRRAEAISDDEDEDEDDDPFAEGLTATKERKGKGKQSSTNPSTTKGAALGPDEDEDGMDNVRVVADGEESGLDTDEEQDGGGEEEEEQQTPETMLELAYIRDPKVFERDAATRRSKTRADLKSQTGWADEQIEGWRVMLERNPGRKEKMLAKHAFTGNEKGLAVHAQGGDGGSRGRGRGAPRGRGRGRGGRGGEGGGGAGGEASARERAWKDKNKASRGNHNRKRGHDKKMARAGAGPSTA